MEKDRSDFAVMNRMIDHIRLLIAVDDAAIPVKKKLETQAILKDFQALLAEQPENQERRRIKGYYEILCRELADEADVAVRMIHACGQVEIARHIVFGGDVVTSARQALASGSPIFCDSEMVAHGITRARLPARNDVICTLNDPRTLGIAEKRGTTRSAAALDLWRDRLAGVDGADL